MLADNGIGVSSFDNNNESVFEDMTVIGLTAKAREFSMFLNPPISSISGVKFASDPSHTQLSLRNVSFRGFEPHFDGTNEYDILALRLWGAFPGMHGAGGESIDMSSRFAMQMLYIIISRLFLFEQARFSMVMINAFGTCLLSRE